MNVGIDVDGTIDAFPVEFLSLCSALVACGHKVFILSGVGDDKVTPADIAAKKAYLVGLGFGKGTYSQLYVSARPHAANKAKLIKQLNVELLIDNTIKNAKAAKELCPVLILWNAKKKK